LSALARREEARVYATGLEKTSKTRRSKT